MKYGEIIAAPEPVCTAFFTFVTILPLSIQPLIYRFDPPTRPLLCSLTSSGTLQLMGNDQQKAFELLRQNRQLQKPLIEKFNGTWIKELGDGVLASFTTVTDAVLCASEIQNACNAKKDFQLRIGIHLGEVLFEDNDVFGDGVNIASRLQAIAPIGGIWISESVYKNISNKKEIRAKFIKKENLKNVKGVIHMMK